MSDSAIIVPIISTYLSLIWEIPQAKNLSHGTVKITWIKCITYFILSPISPRLSYSRTLLWIIFLISLFLNNIYLSSPLTHIFCTFISLFHFITITWPLVEGGYFCCECKPIQGSIYDIHIRWKLYYFSFFLTNTVPLKLWVFPWWYTCILECDKELVLFTKLWIFIIQLEKLSATKVYSYIECHSVITLETILLLCLLHVISLIISWGLCL